MTEFSPTPGSRPPVPGVAVVAGADGSLGQFITTGLRAAGWRVARIAPTSVRSEVDAVVVTTRDDHAMGQAVQATISELGPPTLLVAANDAPLPKTFADVSGDEWSALLDDVVGHALTAARHVVPAMIDHGGGTVLAVSPVATSSGAGTAHYSAAHHTLIGVMRTLAIEVAADGVNVTTIAPVLQPHPDELATSPGFDDGWASIMDTIGYLTGEGSFCTGSVVSPHVTVTRS